MKELDEIDQLFQTTFEGFEATPDPSVKQHIDQAIASKKKRRRFLFILFPVLFGTTTLAAMLYFQEDAQMVQKDQEVHTSTSRRMLVQESSKIQGVQKDEGDQSPIPYAGHQAQKDQSEEQTDQKVRTATSQRMLVQESSKVSFKQPKTVKPKSNQIQKPERKREFNPGIASKTDGNETSYSLLSADKEPVSTTPTQPNQPGSINSNADDIPSKTGDTNSISEMKADSIAFPPVSDSVMNVLRMTNQGCVTLQTQRKWSVSVITGWENESKRPRERFDSLDLSMASTESARIQSTSFYGKFECNRKITQRVDAIAGLGFHSRKTTQSGSLYSLDSFLLFENVSSAPPTDTFGYYIRKQNDSRISQVNSILLPLGIAYSVPLGKVFRFRISGGAELAYSWMKEKQSTPILTRPEFHSFGVNAWLRPEIHYTFGKFQVFGFGTFNQALVRQLNWDFKVPRNPAFGAGIGVLIHL